MAAIVAAGASWGLAAPAHAAGDLCDPGVVFDGADVPGWVETELTCYESAITRDPAEVAGLMAAAVGESRPGT